MISVEDALNKVLGSVQVLEHEEVSLEDAVGRILAEDVFADREMPPFHRVTMDGIAIAFSGFKSNDQLFYIESIGAAGDPQRTLNNTENCIEIMTGASLPEGTDTVVRYEDLKRIDNSFVIETSIKQGQNVHYKGSDHAQSSILLQKGKEIKAIDINVLATVGKSKVPVIRLPKVAVISSGDELVDIDQMPKSYQIRKSNVYMICSRLKQLGIESTMFHLKDVEEEITSQLRAILESFDVLLMSGGVSKGKFDFIPDALKQLGFEKLFHRVAQRPGKPFWFGTKVNKTIFAFPGNPVSTLVCFQNYFIPWFEKSIGQTSKKIKAVLAEDVFFKPDLTYFAQATINQKEDGLFYATVCHGNGSGDIVNPSMMDGFVELPRGKEDFEAGEIVNFIPFYPIFK